MENNNTLEQQLAALFTEELAEEAQEKYINITS